MSPRRSLLIAVLLCATVVWVSGTAGRIAVALPLLLLGPGFLAARALLRSAPVAPLALPAIWIGLSLSFTALLYQWAAALAVALAPALLQALAAAVAVAVALVIWRGEGSGQHGDPGLFPSIRRHRTSALILLLILALTAWTRVEQIRDLAAPAWVDSLHHALLARVAAERGQAPYTLAPYLPVEPLTYHSGYHAFLAALLRVSGAAVPADIPFALLWSGQALNALQALAWAGAAAAIVRRPGAAPAAALVVGLVSIMPAFYVSWGRYTLLAGTLMAPAVIVATLALARAGGRGPLVVCALLLAGLSLVHFVVLCFALCWCAALLVTVWRHEAAARIGAAGALALALTAPWLALLLGEVRLASGASAMSAAGNASYNALPEGLLWAGSNRLLLALAAAGGLLCLTRRSASGAALLLWSGFATLLANPVLLGLPYLSFVTNESLVITLFGPASLLIGAGWGTLEELLTMRAQGHTGVLAGLFARARAPARLRARVISAASAAALVGAAIWSAWQIRSVVRPDTALTTAADMRSVAWVAENTPPDASFVIGAAGWLYTVDRGSDGGWWLLPLAGRKVSTPPVVYAYGPDGYVARVQRESGWVRSGAGRDPDALAGFMRDAGYSYVYTTARDLSLDQAALLAAPRFEAVHQDEDVRIFRLTP